MLVFCIVYESFLSFPGLRDDDLESDSKSQDSLDMRDSRASSPPTLHNGKVQYSHPNPQTDTDVDSEGGPPKLERAVSPSNDSADAKKEDSATDAASPADTIEAIAEPMEGVEEEEEDVPEPASISSPVPVKSQDAGDEEGAKVSEEKENEDTESLPDKCQQVDTDADVGACPTADEKDSAEKESAQIKADDDQEKLPGKDSEKVEDKKVEEEPSEEKEDVRAVKSEGEESSSPAVEMSEGQDMTTVKKEKGEASDEEQTVQVKKEETTVETEDGTEVKMEEQDSPVKTEKDSAVKTEEDSPAVKEEDFTVKSEDSSSLQGDEKSMVKEEKPDYVKLKEKIIQEEMDRLQREKMAKEGLVSTGVGIDGMSVRDLLFMVSIYTLRCTFFFFFLL